MYPKYELLRKMQFINLLNFFKCSGFGSQQRSPGTELYDQMT